MDDEGMSSSFCMKHNARGGGGHYGGGGGGGAGTKCGRWNPTTEQVKVLTDLFRSGLRTPSTDQIQKISSQLSFYGKIESKNVFYWFQNHKARERQKRRRVSVSVSSVEEHKENHFQVQPNNNSSSSSLRRNFVERNHHQVSQPAIGERVIETLQLFPLHSFNESISESDQKLRYLTNDHDHLQLIKENNAPPTSFSCSLGADMDHPTLDLRLSSFL